jgi:NAD+ synthase
MKIKSNKIIKWLVEYSNNSNTNGFVVGVSGGVDSALTSTLCAMTGKKTIVVSMPIHQEPTQHSRSIKHINWLCSKFSNVEQLTLDLSPAYDVFSNMIASSELGLANTSSRLRMVSLYLIANTHNLLVVGTGNKVEDYGVGFFTKYGDGGVDISPIADLLKSEVRLIAKELGVLDELVNAVATDGLWGDNRTDEDQIGATYDELEWALNHYDKFKFNLDNLSERQKEVLTIYVKRHISNKHKLEPPPICKLE